MTAHNKQEGPSNGSGGIYLPSEVASYFRASEPVGRWSPSTRRLFAWIRKGYVAPGQQQTPGRNLVIDFSDLATSQAIAFMRRAGYTFKEIRGAEGYFSRLYGVAQPFAHHAFWIDGADILARYNGQLISGTRQGQIAMDFVEEWIEPVGGRFDFDATGRTIQWTPVDGINLRPSVQFGQPCVAGTRIPTSAVWR